MAAGAARTCVYALIVSVRLSNQALEAWLQFLHKGRVCLVTHCEVSYNRDWLSNPADAVF